jgi:PKHD-type hydroxylase
MKHNWWIWKSELSDEVIDGIIGRCETYPIEDAVVGNDNYDNKIRRSKVRWVGDDSDLRNIIWDFGLTANGNAFGFDIIDKFDIQYTTYNSSDKGCYNWHEDTDFMKDSYYDRKISVVIQLTDPSEYEGGKFEFEINGEIVSPEGFEKKGSIIAFPSFMKHRVTNVTKGTRNSLVSWIQGPHFR